MSDVPATALWVLAWCLALRDTRSAAFSAGTVVTLAVLVRPNLSPLALVPFTLCLPATRQLKQCAGMGRVFAFLGPSSLGLGLMLWVNHALYGSIFEMSYAGASRGFDEV